MFDILACARIQDKEAQRKDETGALALVALESKIGVKKVLFNTENGVLL